jgi:hypothetical protein
VPIQNALDKFLIREELGVRFPDNHLSLGRSIFSQNGTGRLRGMKVRDVVSML